MSDQQDSRGVMALVLGIVGIMMCGVLAPVALFVGRSARNDAMAQGRQPDGMATAGMILGAVGSVLFALQIVLVSLYFVFVFGVVGVSVLSEM